MKKGGIVRSTGFQILLYFLLAAGALCGCFCILITVWLWDWGVNSSSFGEFEKKLMSSEAHEHLDYICEDERNFATLEDIIYAFEAESEANNVKYAIYNTDTEEIVWTNTSSYNIGEYYAYNVWFSRPAPINEMAVIYKGEEAVEENAQAVTGEITEEIIIEINEPPTLDPTTVDYAVEQQDTYQEYRAVIYVDASMVKDDELRRLHESAIFWYNETDLFYMGAIGGCLLCLICFIWILCNAGHRWHSEGILPGVLSNIYLDILTAFFGFVALCILLMVDIFYRVQWDYISAAVIISVVGTVEVVWCTIYMRELALRFKLGKWWQHTLLYALCRLAGKVLRFLGKGVRAVIINLPEIHLVVIALIFLTVCEFLGIMKFVRWGREDLLVCWVLEKIVIIPVILYCSLAFQKLRKGSRALAQGEMSQKMDTRYLLLHFKEHGEDLNRIGNGISKAVEERLQSERLKTELITNVSHDLKTPLTSVINYADLLAVAAAGDGENREEQIQEYSEVLLRQAKRLKKLLEDLVEASKAATGNVELKLVPCELGVMLTQAAGEYEEKFAQKDLKLVMKKPEEEIHVLADGRQLWRVFENLLNNICKYAQENSRVYLSMEQKEGYVEVIFRNISKYELDISPEELTERFVRGDASRHMEGSGLGLSIAKSLVDLQNGTMEILTDGDLFKVILRFEICGEQ